MFPFTRLKLEAQKYLDKIPIRLGTYQVAKNLKNNLRTNTI